MSWKKHSSGQASERQRELSEAKFYFAVLMPVCLVATLISAITSVFTGPDLMNAETQMSIWSKARAQANTIVPFIMMK